MSGFGNSAMSSRNIRPASEVLYNQQFQQLGGQDDTNKVGEQWIQDIEHYETMLEEMAAATLDQEFKDELSAIEQWFRVLSEAERTAATYALIQQTTQMQQRFFAQVDATPLEVVCDVVPVTEVTERTGLSPPQSL